MDYDAISAGKQGGLLAQSLTRSGLENRNGELVLPTADAEVGESLLRFAQALLHVSDLDYLTQERVRSTFVEDVMTLLEARFPGRTERDYNDPERDPKAEYPVDCLINHVARPVAVFAVLNDDRCRDATITLQQFHSWGRQLFSTAIFDAQEEISRRVLARFSNACDKQFASLSGQEHEIVAYIERFLGWAQMVNIDELRKLRSGWDGSDARPVDGAALAAAKAVVDRTGSTGLPEPELFPVPDGGVQIEWRAGPVEIELEIESGGRRIAFVCDDEQAGQQIDGVLPADRSRLALAFSRLSSHA